MHYNYTSSGVKMESSTIINSIAKAYNSSEFQNTYFLGYRDIPNILKMFCQNSIALDYGCGTGRSTRFLKGLGFDCVGVDISKEMLEQAKQNDPVGDYKLISSGQLPFDCDRFDLVFSCFVFLTVPSKDELLKIFLDIKKVLKPGGIFMFVTGSKYLYYKQYISYDIEPNCALRSEEKIQVTLKDLGVQFENYFYSDGDYRELLSLAGLNLVQYHMPLGLDSDQIQWHDEALFGPYLIYTAKK